MLTTLDEAWSSGTPVAIQPVGGHLEFVKAIGHRSDSETPDTC